MRKPLRELREFLASEAITIVTGFCLLWFLQDQVLDAYPVPTPSMEPTIEGDPLHGDRVLVDKTYDNRTRPRRFDMIVFWQEKHRKTVVKRVVGLPGEYIQILHGDLYIGKGRDDLAIFEKLPGRDSDLLATYWDSSSKRGFLSSPLRWDLSDAAKIRKDGYLILDGRGLGYADLVDAGRSKRRAWQLRLRGRITNGYLDAAGRSHERGIARDFGVELWLRGDGTLWIELEHPERTYMLSYRGSKTRLWKGLEPCNILGVPPLAADRERHLVFMYMDGNLCLSVDGSDLGKVRARGRILGSSRRWSRNGLALACTGGRLEISRLKVVHDFHYEAQGTYALNEPYCIEDRSYFVLGDNSANSSDSRIFRTVHERFIIGRPLMIASPFRRFHVFRR
ncbi:MAG: signal peptidase I [Planctomycetota bacterium]